MGWKKKEEVRVPVWARPPGTVPVKPKPRRTPWKPVFLLLALVALAAGAAVLFRQGYFVGWSRTIAQVFWNWSPPLLSSLLFIGIAAVLLLWILPKWQVARSKALTDEKRFDRENEARKTLAQIIGGLFVIGSLFSAVR